MRLGFVSTSDPNASDAMYKPSDVQSGDAVGLAIAQANIQQWKSLQSQWIKGVDNGVVLMAALSAAILLIVATRN